MTTTTTEQLTRITPEKAEYLLSRAVEERGADYVYQRPGPALTGIGPACLYRKSNGEPDCLIALALSYIGPIPQNNWGPAQQAISVLYPDTPQVVLAAMQAAQTHQDAGFTWGEALFAFRMILRGHGL